MTDVSGLTTRVFAIVTMCCLAFQAAAEPNPFLATSGPGVKRSLTPAEVKAPKPSGEYIIQLPNGVELQFQNVSVETNAGVRTIRASKGTTRLLLTTDNRRAYGYVLTDDSYYRIDTSEGQTIIADAKALPDPSQVLGRVVDDAVINYQNFGLDQNLAESPAAANDGPYTVDIAFFYDGALALYEGLQAPRTYAQSAVDYTNAAFATHSLDVQLRLVYVGELSVPLTGDPWSTFIGNADRLDILAEYGVDLGHYIYNYNWTQGYCGLGYIPGQSAVSAVECGNSTIAHEIGHNFGMNHDRPNANYINLPYNGYHFGDWCGGSATLMTYAFGAPELPFYSSPLQSFGGEPCGVAVGELNAAYNAEVVNATKAQTAGYVPAQTIYGGVSITTVGPLQLTEGVDSQSLIKVTRDGDLSVETSVEIGLVGIEATAGADYADAVERLTFLPGESVKEFTLDILDDESYEPVVETLEVVIRYPSGLAVTGPSLTVQITSDDPDRGLASFPTYYRYVDEGIGEIVIDVDRIGSSGLPLTVAFETVADAAKPGIDYVETSGNVVFAANQTAATISIPIIDDDLFEGVESKRFFVHLVGDNIDPQNAWFWVYVRNDDLNRGELRLSSDTYFVMENDSSLDVTIERINGFEDSHFFWLRSSNGTAISYQDFVATSIRTTVGAGTTSRTITLSSILNNDIADGEKYFNLDLEPDWGSANPIHAQVYIIDDEAPTESGGVLNVASSSVVASEDGGFAEIAIQRQSGSAGAAIVSYSTTPGTASAAVDYNDRSGTVGWVDGDVSDKIVQIPIINDGIVETDETFNFTISNAGGAVLGSSLTTVVSIADNDGPGTLSFDLSKYTLSETGWVDVAVVREMGSVGAVSVSYQTIADSAESNIDYSAAQGSVGWSNGDTGPKYIRLYGIDDSDFEFRERFRVELSDPVGGAELGDLASTIVTISTSDAPAYQPTFGDISEAHWAWLYIHALADSGITAGCGNGNYCPDGIVTRAQMAVFLERGMNGSGFSPPAASGNVFLDVGATDFAASFIEQLASDGITAGCGNGNYCPEASVTRDQMAVFLLRAKYGSSYSPPAATGMFGDVDLGHWAARWIEQLAAEDITAGCGNGNYCPDTDVTRDQMAVFLIRTFGL